jgi:hypothetical protein
LGVLGDIGGDAEDLVGGIGGDITITIVGTGLEDFSVSEICQCCWRKGFGCSIAMAVHNEDSKNGFLSLDEMEEGPGCYQDSRINGYSQPSWGSFIIG